VKLLLILIPLRLFAHPHFVENPGYGNPFDEFRGVQAFANKIDTKNKKQSGKHQCTELVHRFYRKVYKIPTKIGIGLGHGKDLAKNLAQRFDLRFYKNRSETPPEEGSVLSIKTKTVYGHVLIVKKVVKLSENKIRLHTFQQNKWVIFKKKAYLLRDGIRYLYRSKEGLWFNKKFVGWTLPPKVL